MIVLLSGPRLGRRRAAGPRPATAPPCCGPGWRSIAVAVPVAGAGPGVPGLRGRAWRRTASRSASSTPPRNMQAVALEHRYDRPLLPSFHGAVDPRRPARRRARAGHRRPAVRDHRPGRAWCRAWCCWGRSSAASTGGAGRRRKRGAVAADHPGRHRVGALLHGRHRGGDLGTDLPRRRLRRPGAAGGAGDLPLPAGQRAGAAGRGRAGRAVRPRPGAARRGRARLVRAGRRRVRTDLAGRGARLRAARRRRRGDRAAELLGRRPDRRRRPGTRRPGRPGWTR